MAEPIKDEAWRCKVVRFMVAGDNQTLFVAKIDNALTIKQWNNFERGLPLSKPAAITLAQKIQGLTTDWLWFGYWGGVPGRLREELEAAEKALISAEGKARKRG